MKKSPSNIDYSTWVSLKAELDALLPAILRTTKSVSNENRLLILLKLLEGPQSFQSLLEAIKLKKTALANHLAILIEDNLVQKPGYARYEVTMEGKNILRSLVEVQKKNLQAEKMRLKESRQMSSHFIKEFFKK